MTDFGEFLYGLRKEKGLTQAELAEALGVTNKAVSKWETGEAMPETSLLIPISRIFGVSVDELLNGRRAEKSDNNNRAYTNAEAEKILTADDIYRHIFTRGKDGEENKTFAEKLVGAVCATVVFACITVYIFLGALLELWAVIWVIIPVGALSAGIIGIIGDVCNPVKRKKKMERGENPYIGCVCGLIILLSVNAYLIAGVITGMWHPLWIIVVVGAVACFAVGAVGDLFLNNKK